MTKQEAIKILSERYLVPDDVINTIKEALSYNEELERHFASWEPVVRCKDCKHWNEWENGTGSCIRSENGYNWFGVDDTDFCSFGERKDKPDGAYIGEDGYLKHDLVYRGEAEPTVSEKESVEGVAESATTTDCISRKDAIEEIALHDCTNGEVPYFTGKGVQEILNNLPPVTPTVSEDCISRDYMLKLQRELHGWMSNDKNHELWQKIKDAPSVTPTERTGEWTVEEKDSIYGKKIRLTCSECGDVFDISEAAYPYERYCRYCGAKMGGDSE